MSIAVAGIDGCQDRLVDYIQRLGRKRFAQKTGFSLDSVDNWTKRKSWPGLPAYLHMRRALGKSFDEYVTADWLDDEALSIEDLADRIQADMLVLKEIAHTLKRTARHEHPTLSDQVARMARAVVCDIRDKADQSGRAVKQGAASAIVFLALLGGMGGALQPDDAAVRVPSARTVRVREALA